MSDYLKDVILLFWVVTLRNIPEARIHHPHGGKSSSLADLMR
jgi:hypothetical protein